MQIKSKEVIDNPASNYFKGSQRITLSGVVLADTFYKRLERFQKTAIKDSNLLINLSGADHYIDIVVLVGIISVLTDRSKNGLLTFLYLPKNKKRRDFLKVWRFPEAVSDATKTEFSKFLVKEDIGFNEERLTSFGGNSPTETLEYDPNWNESSLSKRNFFEFSSFRMCDRNSHINTAVIPRIETERWSKVLIKSVLKKHFFDDSDSYGVSSSDVSRVIIFEALSNAIRHPGATVVQCTSRFGKSTSNNFQKESATLSDEKEKIQGSLQLCFWDDGQSIPDTLMKVHNSGMPIRSDKTLPYYESQRYAVSNRYLYPTNLSDEKINKVLTIDTTWTPKEGEEVKEARLLLASLFPGITQSLSVDVPLVEPADNKEIEVEDSNPFNGPGMGLYALTRTVVDQFQGELIIRSGHHRVKVKKSPTQYSGGKYNARYFAKITHYDPLLPKYHGNLVEIRIPKHIVNSN